MKKLCGLKQKYPALFGVFVCYAGAVLLFLLLHTAGLAANRVLYATGVLVPENLSLSDFELAGMDINGDELWTYDADPQLLLKDTARRVENVTLMFHYQRPARACMVFWAKAGQGYSLRRMGFSQNGGGAVFFLPVTGVQSLRIDPDTQPGNLITVSGIAINQPRPFWAFFVPGAAECLLLLAGPGLAASGLSIVKQAAGTLKKQKAGKTP